MVPGVRRRGRAVLRAAGYDFDVDPLSYELDLDDDVEPGRQPGPQAQEPRRHDDLVRLRPDLPVFLSGTANREGYYPEFVSGYEQDFIGQLWDPEFQRQLRHQPARPNNGQPAQETIGYAAFKCVSDDEPANGVDGLYYQLYMVAIGVQLAGPNLTPETFEQGMFSYPERLGPAGLWGFGPQDYTPMDDYHEIYWDADDLRPTTASRAPGSTPTPGKRYRHGADEMPTGPPGDPE